MGFIIVVQKSSCKVVLLALIKYSAVVLHTSPRSSPLSAAEVLKSNQPSVALSLLFSTQMGSSREGFLLCPMHLISTGLKSKWVAAPPSSVRKFKAWEAKASLSPGPDRKSPTGPDPQFQQSRRRLIQGFSAFIRKEVARKLIGLAATRDAFDGGNAERKVGLSSICDPQTAWPLSRSTGAQQNFPSKWVS